MVCVCSHLCAHVCRSPVCGGERLTSNVFLDHSQPPILRQGLWLKLWLDSAILSSQLALGFPCLLCWVLGSKVKHPACLALKWMLWIWSLSLTLVWQGFFHWAVSPAPVFLLLMSTDLPSLSISILEKTLWTEVARLHTMLYPCHPCLLPSSAGPDFRWELGHSFALCWATEVVLFVFRGLLSSLHLISSLHSAPGTYRGAAILPKPLFYLLMAERANKWYEKRLMKRKSTYALRMFSQYEMSRFRTFVRARSQATFNPQIKK